MKNSKKNVIGFRYGALCPTLEVQAKDQGYTLKNYNKLELQRKSINVLSLNDLLTDSQTDKIFNKFHKRVIKNLTKK